MREKLRGYKMYLAKLKLWNFRKYGSSNEIFVEGKLRKPDLEANFKKGLNVLVGENDSGKTTLIDSIKIVLKTYSFDWIRIEPRDFFGETTRLRIECILDELEPNEAKNFLEWLTIKDENGNVLDKPQLKLILDVQRKDEYKIFSYEVCAGADDEGSILSAEAKNYLRITYLKPLRDAENELIPKRNSRLSKVLFGYPLFKDRGNDHDFVKKFEEFRKNIEDYFIDPSQGKEINDKILSLLKKFFGEEKKSFFTSNDKKLLNVLELLGLGFAEDKYLGLGSNNLLFIATELLNLDRTDDDELKLCLIEELEAHLHPQAQLKVIETLQEQKNIQFILTSHSPNLASKVKLENLIFCEKRSSNVFPMGENYTKLDENGYKFLERFLDVTKANLFFAKGIILVEGWAEEILLPILAKKIGINLTEKGVSIVNVANVAFLNYAKIFLRKTEPSMQIPVAIITDLDLKPVEFTNLKGIKKITKKKKNLCIDGFDSAELENYRKKKIIKKYNVETFISEYWTLEYCLALSNNLRKYFYKAVLLTVLTQKQEKGIQNTTKYETAVGNYSNYFNNFSNPQQDIAFNIYMQILGEYSFPNLCKEKLSKTIIAQHFAKILEKEIELEICSDDDSIKYLFDAIKHVTR